MEFDKQGILNREKAAQQTAAKQAAQQPAREKIAWNLRQTTGHQPKKQQNS